MSTENLYNTEAKQKIKSIAESVDFCMMATNLSEQPLQVIPMSTKKVDDQGNIWFLSGKDSDHNAHIRQDPKSQLMYSGGSSKKFLSVYGTTEIVNKLETIKELYGSTDNAWFDGPQDPNCTALCFTPKEAAYWDTKGNKLMTLFKMAKGAITGEQQDLGTSGKAMP